MNDYIETIKKSIELSDVLKDGINYVKETIIFREYGELDDLIGSLLDSVIYLKKAFKSSFFRNKR